MTSEEMLARIRKSLEAIYGIPFNVGIEHKEIGASVRVAPVSAYNDRFTLVYFVANRLRLRISLEPDSYSKPLFQSMALADSTSRELFLKYSSILEDDARSASFIVNGVNLFREPASAWPQNWDSAQLDIEVFPVPEYLTEVDLLSYLWPWIEKTCGLMFSLIDIAEEELGEAEGSRFSVVQTKYERSAKNRAACLIHYGHSCMVCGMNFEETYGPIGSCFIHVHHIVPVSQLGEGYKLDPVSDLIPVCPNCHAMLHRKNPPLPPSELKKMLKG